MEGRGLWWEIHGDWRFRLNKGEPKLQQQTLQV